MIFSNTISDRLHEIRERIVAAAVRAGRDADAVRLVAISKTFPVESVRQACDAGQRQFGESRVREWLGKIPQLPGDCEWHFIGHLQANKARQVVRAAAWIHSVNSLELIPRLDRIAGEEGRRPVILLELNMSGEAAKTGAEPVAARALAEAALQCPHLDLRGFMTMAPWDAPETEVRRVFDGLRELRDRVSAELGAPLPELSMGMSGDFETAIACGATLVRIGTALFGAR